MLGWGDEKSTAMSSKSSSAVATMGIDIGKNSFHVIGLDARGAIVLRQKWSRASLKDGLPALHRA
jgi:transposase